ncbi:MAG: aminopeptidase [Oscillospiraceae bacterium]|nr:aminopeptidase [Oscillospiraceae bacterium]MCL2279050.1 aminopeptidase [Oscillospiraceae bacterium]
MSKTLYNEAYLDEYVELVIRHGVNIQKGQELLISCPADCAYFARKAMAVAFEAGASNVHLRWSDDICARTKFLKADDKVFDTFPAWDKLMMESLSEGGAAFLSVVAQDPEVFKGVAPDRLSRFNKASSVALKPYFEKIITGGVRWSIAAVPSEAWAKKVFPNAGSAEDSMKSLWESIFNAVRVSGDGKAVDKWGAHKDALRRRVKLLNDYHFESIHLKNSAGTDLVMKLPKTHLWTGGGDVAKDGFEFLPNIPTEEIFSAPQFDGVDGTVVGTMPNVFRGNLIDEYSITFKDGKVVSYDAKVGKEHLEGMINDIKNMDYLGEIALVEHDSPISNMGILFYNTLYDENASCHLALGSAYPDCIKGGGAMSEEERKAAGINVCDSHHDFMFGSADMSIVGTTASGEKVTVFENGNFAI